MMLLCAQQVRESFDWAALGRASFGILNSAPTVRLQLCVCVCVCVLSNTVPALGRLHDGSNGAEAEGAQAGAGNPCLSLFLTHSLSPSLSPSLPPLSLSRARARPLALALALALALSRFRSRSG